MFLIRLNAIVMDCRVSQSQSVLRLRVQAAWRSFMVRGRWTLSLQTMRAVFVARPVFNQTCCLCDTRVTLSTVWPSFRGRRGVRLAGALIHCNTARPHYITLILLTVCVCVFKSGRQWRQPLALVLLSVPTKGRACDRTYQPWTACVY